MSRSGYSDDYSQWDAIKWRGQVASAIRGKRGQAFLRELIEALDAMPIKQLIRDDLENKNGEVCALGAVGLKRKMDMSGLDPYDYETLAGQFNIAHQLVQEIEYVNDDTSEENFLAESNNKGYRWQQVRAWAEQLLVKP